jgi:hypothetical protein
MNVRKLIFAGSATALGLGLAGVPAIALADSSPSTDDSPTVASTTQPPVTQRPTVTQSSGMFTVTAPGVGSLSFGIDPTTGAVTGLTVTPAAGTGFTAGPPMQIEEGFEVLFTGASGSQLLRVKVDRDDGATEVRARIGPPPAAPQAGVTPGQNQDGDQDANHGDDNGVDRVDDHGDDNGVENDQDEATTTTMPGTPTIADHNEDTHGGDGRPATTTTTPATSSGQSGSSPGGPGLSSGPDGSGDQGSNGNDGSDGSGSGSGGGPGGPGGSGSNSGHDSSGSDH